MNTKLLQSWRSGSRSTTHRKRSSARSMILALLVALCITALTAHAFGQGECLSLCERDLAACLRAGGSDPVPSGFCQDSYDACCQACIGF